jgi:hypothetical protein
MTTPGKASPPRKCGAARLERAYERHASSKKGYARDYQHQHVHGRQQPMTLDGEEREMRVAARPERLEEEAHVELPWQYQNI